VFKTGAKSGDYKEKTIIESWRGSYGSRYCGVRGEKEER
jgi:hypothetical protein